MKSSDKMQADGSEPFGRPSIKREIKSSVFTDLFSDPKYAFQFFQAFHPEDHTTTEDEVQIITLDNVLTDKQYNDLGFRIGDRLIILVEHQSTWSENIVVRVFLLSRSRFKITSTNINSTFTVARRSSCLKLKRMSSIPVIKRIVLTS